MISPISSGNSSPPGPLTKEKNLKRKASEPEISIDLKLNQGLTTGGLPQFLRKKISFREATHSESLKGIISNAKNSHQNQSSDAPAFISYIQNLNQAPCKLKSDTSSLNNGNSDITARDIKYGFKGPEIDLFPRDRLKPFLKWTRIRSIGPGLSNMGNTCFLNSVLQCLFYTTPLAEFLLAREHSKRCRVAGGDEFCGLCVLERLMQKVHRQGESVIRPIELVSKIKAIGKHFRPGRQEDSHEFLRLFIESLQKASLPKSQDNSTMVKLDVRSKETTPIHRIFGGHLQSTVTCSSCKHVSRTFDKFLDLSLDVNKAESISSAFKIFTTPELLSKGNRYKCEACHRLVDAHKQFSIYKSPEIMTIQLKRFSVNPFTGQTTKLNRPIAFSEHLNISEFMGNDRDQELKENDTNYLLYGVLVHEGNSCNSGHYHAFVKNSNDIWYSMNDCSVHQVSLDTVLRQRAYILFYKKTNNNVNISNDFSDQTNIKKNKMENSSKPVEKHKRTMEEKMISLKEASRIYTSSMNLKLNEHKKPVEKAPVKDEKKSIAKKFLKQDQLELIPCLVDSTYLRSSSMWHMSIMQKETLNHSSIASKRIKNNFANSWRVDKI